MRMLNELEFAMHNRTALVAEYMGARYWATLRNTANARRVFRGV